MTSRTLVSNKSSWLNIQMKYSRVCLSSLDRDVAARTRIPSRSRWEVAGENLKFNVGGERGRVEALNTALIHTAISSKSSLLLAVNTIRSLSLSCSSFKVGFSCATDFAFTPDFFVYTSSLVSTRIHALAVACYCLHPTQFR